MPVISFLKKIFTLPSYAILGFACHTATFFCSLGLAATAYAKHCGVQKSIFDSACYVEMWTNGRIIDFAFVITATTLIYYNPGMRLFAYGKRISDNSVRLLLALQKLRNTMAKSKSRRDYSAFYRLLLEAAVIDINSSLNLPSTENLKANLLFLRMNSTNDESLEVIQRSSHDGIGIFYPFNEELFTSAKAIALNRTHVDCDVKKIRGPIDPYIQDKPYNCVAAVPITDKSKAYGAISVDCKGKKTLGKHQAKIDEILRPYCELVLMTLPDDIHVRPCPDYYSSNTNT